MKNNKKHIPLTPKRKQNLIDQIFQLTLKLGWTIAIAEEDHKKDLQGFSIGTQTFLDKLLEVEE